MSKIVLSGGGTLGPVAPLLAIYESYKREHIEAEFIWVGTKTGPEKELVEKYGIKFFALTSGKFRRYFSLANLFDPFKIVAAFFEAVFFLRQEKPQLVISAGGYVSVPLHLAAVCLGIPQWVHQQDLRPGLANKIMARFANKITTALQASVKFYPAKKTDWLGNPVRDLSVDNAAAAKQRLGLSANQPIIFALGGGTGAQGINKLILEALPVWPEDWQVVHLTGRGRAEDYTVKAAEVFKNYHPYTFFNEQMRDAYAAADVVIARAGFATLTELASLKKALVVVPMPDSHQEDNAELLKQNNAAIMLNQQVDGGIKLAEVVKNLIEAPQQRLELGQKLFEILPPADSRKINRIIDGLVSR